MNEYSHKIKNIEYRTLHTEHYTNRSALAPSNLKYLSGPLITLGCGRGVWGVGVAALLHITPKVFLTEIPGYSARDTVGGLDKSRGRGHTPY